MTDDERVEGTELDIDCEEALRRLAKYLDGELGDQEHAAVRRHLETCRSCWSRAEFERRLRTRLGELREGEVSADFERRIRQLIRSGSAW